VRDRFTPAAEQKFQLGVGIGIYSDIEKYRLSNPAWDLPERIQKGEFKLPPYMDLARMPEMERRVIFGMMVGNEGKTRIPIYDQFTKAGFDPDRNLLQTPVMPVEGYRISNYWMGVAPPNMRMTAGGGLLVDWNLRTSLEGLYAAGGFPLFGPGCHGESHTTGRYAGRKAAAHARTAAEANPDRTQVEAEKVRAYALLKQSKKGVGWKELNYAIARVMRDYAGK
jgi:succinate dehydrogenase/fumarate reductase flavoprotein subunit